MTAWGAIELERAYGGFPGKTVARNALSFEGFHETNVRPEDRHPSEGSEDGDD